MAIVSTRRPKASDRARHAWADAATEATRYIAPLGGAAALRAVGELLLAGPAAWRRCAGVMRREANEPFGDWVRRLALLLPAAKLRSYCREREIDHLHVHSANRAAWLALLCQQLGGPSYSLTLHGALNSYGSGQRAKWSHAAFGITINEQLRNALCDRLGELPTPIDVAPMGVDLETFTPEESYQPWRRGPLMLVSCSRLHRGKGHQDLIEAVARLHQRGWEVELTILGEGEYRNELERLIEQNELRDRVRLPGACSEAMVKKTLAASHIYALASRNEALGVATMEAMAMHRPVVVTDVGGVGELVDDGVHGRRVPPESPDAIAEAIKQIARNPEQAAAMGERGRQRIEARFSSRRSAEAIAARLNVTTTAESPANQPTERADAPEPVRLAEPQ